MAFIDGLLDDACTLSKYEEADRRYEQGHTYDRIIVKGTKAENTNQYI